MALISVAELEAFTGNVETDNTTLKTTLCAAASSVVTDYLGYDPISATRYYRTVGVGFDFLILPIPAVASVSSITEDGTVLAATSYSLVSHGTKYWIERTDGLHFLRDVKIVVTYLAGSATAPDIIKHATLRIAALMLEETHGNIGISSKSFADLSKTFINYTNYAKYLAPLAPYVAESI